MKFTLLVDLDDTLLISNMDNFIPAYFQALSSNLQDLVEPELMLKSLMTGTKKMMTKTSSQGSLSELFDESFYNLIGIEKEAIKNRLDQFYDEIFPSLGYLTSQKSDAIEFINRAFSENHRVVIATNPVFPIKAVEHRLRWAGLDPEHYDFSLITSFEDSHFTKENITYFPEILGRLGWPDDPVVMIGNDLEMDIKPAVQAGISVFWVEDSANKGNEFDGVPKGTLSEFFPWFYSQEVGDLKFSNKRLSPLLHAITATPAVFDGWLNSNGKNAQIEMNISNKNILIKSITELLNTEKGYLSDLDQFIGSGVEDRMDLSTFKNRIHKTKDQYPESELEEFTFRRQAFIDTISKNINLRSDFIESGGGNKSYKLLKKIFSNDKEIIRNTFQAIVEK